MAAEIVNPRSDSSIDSGIQRTGAADTGADEPFDPAFALHRGGKMAVQATVPIRDKDDLSLAYTPGVAKVCSAIADNPELVHDYTWKSQVVAVVTDGTAVLAPSPAHHPRARRRPSPAVLERARQAVRGGAAGGRAVGRWSRRDGRRRPAELLEEDGLPP
ncbi:Malic enzyme, N-terminal domain [Streptomyces griseus]|nr:Malic enzyme, N-terminal domain [Streptomyces griseus]